MRRTIACLLAAACCLSSPAAASSVDGISDQSLPSWDNAFGGWFTAYFQMRWVDGGQIRYARYVPPWNVAMGGSPYLAKLERWYDDARLLGLTLDVSLTVYPSVARPDSTAAYARGLERILERFPAIRYVEAWNEPNGPSTFLPASVAAEYALAASQVCARRDCTAIAGDFLDVAGMGGYEREYSHRLEAFKAKIRDWGIHPYRAVADRIAAPIGEFEAGWPAGEGKSVWFTEVGAYECVGRAVLGEGEQAADARWLVDDLIPAARPAHVFYYELLDGDRTQPQTECEEEGHPDSALFVPGGDPREPDVPRPAAAWVLGDGGRSAPLTPAVHYLRYGLPGAYGGMTIPE